MDELRKPFIVRLQIKMKLECLTEDSYLDVKKENFKTVVFRERT